MGSELSEERGVIASVFWIKGALLADRKTPSSTTKGAKKSYKAKGSNAKSKQCNDLLTGCY